MTRTLSHKMLHSFSFKILRWKVFQSLFFVLNQIIYEQLRPKTTDDNDYIFPPFEHDILLFLDSLINSYCAHFYE